MEKQLTNINQFFDVNELADKKLEEIVNSKEFDAVKKEIKSKLKGVPVPTGFFKRMISQVGELLNIDLRGVLAKAWSRSGDLVKYLGDIDVTSDEIVLLPLMEHAIKTEHKPSFKPKINKLPLKDIKFNVFLELKLKGVILNIQKGKIIQAEIGSCIGNGTVKYKSLSLFEKKSKPLTLPKQLDFGDGIDIGLLAKQK